MITHDLVVGDRIYAYVYGRDWDREYTVATVAGITGKTIDLSSVVQRFNSRSKKYEAKMVTESVLLQNVRKIQRWR